MWSPCGECIGKNGFAPWKNLIGFCSICFVFYLHIQVLGFSFSNFFGWSNKKLLKPKITKMWIVNSRVWQCSNAHNKMILARSHCWKYRTIIFDSGTNQYTVFWTPGTEQMVHNGGINDHPKN
jgi:hypothetical protein